METLKLENAKKVLDKATSQVMATRAEHDLFILSINALYEAATEAEKLKSEIEQLKEKLK